VDGQSIWFYGEDLCRYDLAKHDLQRINPVAGSFGAIRKLVVDGAGVWLATHQGLFHIERASGVVRSVSSSPAAQLKYLGAVSNNGVLWFAADGPTLVRVSLSGPDR